jgi:hypothetical protein
MRRIVMGSLVGLALAVTTTSAAPARNDSPTIVLVPPTGIQTPTTTAWPRVGDTVAFVVTYPKQLDRYALRIQIVCYQNADMVWADAAPYDSTFVLGGTSSDWVITGGAANCAADLYYWSYNGGQKLNWLAATYFDVAGAY